MASGDYLKRLFKTFNSRDSEAFKAVALEIIADEKRKNHNVLASDLLKILNNGVTENGLQKPSHFRESEVPKDAENGALLVEIKTNQKFFSDLVVSEGIREKLLAVLEEQNSREILRGYGMYPKQKILFAGPPGCGKTLAAHVIATELGLPMLYARFDSVISSYLGQTATNLKKVFDYSTTSNWVLFFDEFDAIGKSRGSNGEHGELKRVVNTFLQLLDNYQSAGIVIAATNHEEILDKAIWRRFDEIVFFSKPNDLEKSKLIELKLRNFPHKTVNVDKLLPLMADWAHSDVERACFEAIKAAILTGTDEVSTTSLREAISLQQERIDLINKNL